MRSEVGRRLFVVTVLAHPDPTNRDWVDAGGAYVTCWIDTDSDRAALLQAETEIRDAGWVLESIENLVVATREDYEEDGPNLAYFDQALIDKVVLVFHTWPNHPQDGDPTH